jgi:hypothetical protein
MKLSRYVVGKLIYQYQLMSYNMMIGIYDRFTMKHFPLRQSVILTPSFFFFCSRQYLTKDSIINIKMAVTDNVIFIRN